MIIVLRRQIGAQGAQGRKKVGYIAVYAGRRSQCERMKTKRFIFTIFILSWWVLNCLYEQFFDHLFHSNRYRDFIIGHNAMYRAYNHTCHRLAIRPYVPNSRSLNSLELLNVRPQVQLLRETRSVLGMQVPVTIGNLTIPLISFITHVHKSHNRLTASGLIFPSSLPSLAVYPLVLGISITPSTIT